MILSEHWRNDGAFRACVTNLHVEAVIEKATDAVGAPPEAPAEAPKPEVKKVGQAAKKAPKKAKAKKKKAKKARR